MKNNSPVFPEQTALSPLSEFHYGKPAMPLFLGLTAQELYESVNAIPVYLWVHGGDHKVVYHNQLVKEKFGNCVGQNCHSCLMRKKHACSCCRSKEILEGKRPFKCHGCKRGGNGQLFDSYHTPLVQHGGARYILSVSTVNGKGQENSKAQFKSSGKDEQSYCSMCSGCKKIKYSEENWVDVEKFLSDNFQLKTSHGLCRACTERLYPKLGF